MNSPRTPSSVQTGAQSLRQVPSRRSSAQAVVSPALARLDSLCRAIANTRAEIDNWTARHEHIRNHFDQRIRPLEQRLTHGVAVLTRALLVHHENTPLAVDDRMVLGLWINDNLSALSMHPFADADEVAALCLRWRGMLRPAVCRAEHANAEGPVARGGDGTADNTQADERAGEQAKRAGRDSANGDCDADRPSSHSSPDDPPRHRSETGESSSNRQSPSDGAGTTNSSTPNREANDLDALVERLFRQLARVLHPDREQDESRKLEKDHLMSACLQARGDSDIAALLAMHARHVGSDDALTARESAVMQRSLELQLRGLRHRLRRLRASDSLEQLIHDRYASTDLRDTERRFEAHAEHLGRESRRIESLVDSLNHETGLRLALDTERNRLLDQIAIRELTGAG